MCRAFQEVRDEGRQEGRQEGIQEGRAEEKSVLVKAVLSKGKSPEETAELLNLAVEEVKAIAGLRKEEGARL